MKKLSIAMLAGVMLFAGCEAMPIVNPSISLYIKWLEGEADCYFAADREAAYRATKRSLTTLGYTVTKDEIERSGDHTIVAGGNDRFKIKVELVEPYVTRISIRVNFIGDKPYAELIYRQVIDQLDVIEYKVAEKRFRQHRATPSRR